MKDIKLFQSTQIRSVWNDEAGEWFFSVIDVVGALTDSADTKQYIKKMRSRDSELNSNWGTICTPLKMLAPDGKMRKSQTANTEGILRIIQSIPSPKAEPFKQWLAQLGADRIHDLEAAEAFNKEIDARIEARNNIKQHNVALADAAFAAGVKTNLDFAKFQNSGYKGIAEIGL